MIRKIHIRSSVFVWYSDKKVLFYDTKNYSHLLLSITDKMKEVLAQIKRPEAMYSFSFEDEQNLDVLRLTDVMKEKGFCIEEKGDEHFVSLPPVLGINNNWEILKKEGKHLATIELLRTISFFLGMNDLFESFLETSFCNMRKTDGLLDLQELDLFFESNKLDYLKNLYFFVGYGCTLDYLSELERVVSKYQLNSIVKIIYVVGESNMDVIIGGNTCSLHQTVIYANVPEQITSGFEEYTFIVRSNEELNGVKGITDSYNLQSYKVYPYYNGSNCKFIEDVLFSDIDDILNQNISKRQIYIHQTLNINYFGHLFVSPSNEVYSNPFSPPLGRLSEGIYSLVYKEMDNSYLWRMIRSEYGQCQSCLYRDLCPSPILEEVILDRKCRYYVA